MNNDSRKKWSFTFSIQGATGSMTFPFGQIKLRSSQTVSLTLFKKLSAIFDGKWLSQSCVCTCACGLPHLIRMKHECKKTRAREKWPWQFFSMLLIYYLFLQPVPKKKLKAALSIVVICRLLSYVCEYFVDWLQNTKLLKIILKRKEGREAGRKEGAWYLLIPS